MTVVEIFTDTLKKMQPQNEYSPAERLLARGMTLCSDATYTDGVATGDPTEVALLLLADEMGISRDQLVQDAPRIGEFPFDSDRKLMSVQVEEHGEKVVYTKGAIDNILHICDSILVGDVVVPITMKHKETILEMMAVMSDKALRTLGLAYKKSDSLLNPEEMESGLTFVGMVGMIDPPRAEVKDSIALAKAAGITPVMITGDYPNTAFAIAYELGMANDHSEVITGKEIDMMSEEEFTDRVPHYRVFARVSPEHKVRIVRALRAQGNIVSMTGDGVNDAPSLNAADIGVAMGITGTDVAKGAASMILLDDNFTTIVSAVEQGRIIYQNIKKAVIFLLSCNLGEVVAMVIVLLIGLESPLLAIQLLWINLVTDSFPAVALGMDAGDKEVMKEKPRSPKESFFSHGAGLRTVLFGVMMGVVTIVAFLYGYYSYGVSPFDENLSETATTHARTLAFMTLVLTQMFFTLSIRSEYTGLFSRRLFENKILLVAVMTGILLQLVILSIPFLRDIFHLGAVHAHDWILIILMAGIPTLINEIRKWLKRR